MMLVITDKEFKKLADYILANYGIYLKEEKQALVSGRLQNVLLQNNFNNFSDYYDYVVSDKTGNAAAILLNKITTNHTFFMREADHFYFFRDKVIPYLKDNVREKDIRIWSAGCSTGEEPSTLAMIIDEAFGREKVFWDTKILATDISGKVLEEAQKGVYGSGGLSDIPAQWKLNYFRRIGANQFELTDSIRNQIIYRKFNLMEETFPFRRKFHVIFCRNVMIYFNTQTKRALVNKFYDSLESGGFLFIGHSESLSREETKFRYVMPAVYKKE